MWFVWKVILLTLSIAFVKDYYTFTTIKDRVYISISFDDGYNITFRNENIENAILLFGGYVNSKEMSLDLTTICNIVDLYTQGRLEWRWFLIWIFLSPVKLAIWPSQLRSPLATYDALLLVYNRCLEILNTTTLNLEKLDACFDYSRKERIKARNSTNTTNRIEL